MTFLRLAFVTSLKEDFAENAFSREDKSVGEFQLKPGELMD